jgi:cell division transport system ATP-binding protein
MVHLFGVGKDYEGTPALRGLTFSVERGEFVYVTGASGAGKTSLLKILFCEERPSLGQAVVNGCNVGRMTRHEIPALRRQIGVVFQDFRLLTKKPVIENVAFLHRILGMPKKERLERAFYFLKLVGLEHKAEKYPLQLSGGEQQRVAIARAIAAEPVLLLADEPTGNLDPEMAEEIFILFKRINAAGTTVMIATHDRALIARHPKRILTLRGGTLADDSGPEGPRPPEGYFA